MIWWPEDAITAATAVADAVAEHFDDASRGQGAACRGILQPVGHAVELEHSAVDPGCEGAGRQPRVEPSVIASSRPQVCRGDPDVGRSA